MAYLKILSQHFPTQTETFEKPIMVSRPIFRLWT